MIWIFNVQLMQVNPFVLKFPEWIVILMVTFVFFTNLVVFFVSAFKDPGFVEKGSGLVSVIII
jgi:hypothetical protein